MIVILPQFHHCDCVMCEWLNFGTFFKFPCIVRIYAWFFMHCRNHHSDNHANHVITMPYKHFGSWDIDAMWNFYQKLYLRIFCFEYFFNERRRSLIFVPPKLCDFQAYIIWIYHNMHILCTLFFRMMAGTNYNVSTQGPFSSTSRSSQRSVLCQLRACSPACHYWDCETGALPFCQVTVKHWKTRRPSH